MLARIDTRRQGSRELVARRSYAQILPHRCITAGHGTHTSCRFCIESKDSGWYRYMTDVTDSFGPRELADWLLARGRYWVTTTEAAELLRIPEHHVARSVAQSRQRRYLFSPAP